MRSSSVSDIIKTVYRGGTRPGSEFKDRLEAELVHHHQERFGPRAAGRAAAEPVGGRHGSLRWIVATAAVLVTVAVGSIPVGLSMGIGKLITVHLPARAAEPPSVVELQQLAAAVTGADEVSASVSRSATGESTVLLVTFGEPMSDATLTARLAGAHPAFAGGRFEIEELHGEVRTSLARKIGAGLFALDVSLTDVESARREITRKLAERGIGAGTTVKVKKDGAAKRIDIQLEGTRAP